MTLSSLVAGIAGAAIVALVLWDAFETILVPRRIGRRHRLTDLFYIFTWRLWRGLARGVRGPSRREALLATYAPLSIIMLLTCWAAGLIVGFTLLQFSANSAPALAGTRRLFTLLYLSGETFFTLGYGDLTPSTTFGRLLSVVESGMGFGFLGTVIGYLPTMYAAFSSREVDIALLDARAGSPPTAAEFLRRTSSPDGPTWLDVPLREWEHWCARLLESTISYPLLAYYRSQHSNQSWLATLTIILDSTALILAGAGGVRTEQAQLTFAMARHAVVDITQIFVTDYRPPARDRLPAAELARLREHLARTQLRIPDTDAFAARLAALRRQYEPYAQVLAEHLNIELPPWVHPQSRRDNWRGGPWDKVVGGERAAALWDEEHF